MLDALLIRLRAFGLEDGDARHLVERAVLLPNVSAQTDIATKDPSSIHVVEDGWAYRYRLLADGRRQIVSIHLPGDVCDLGALFGSSLPGGIAAMTSCRMVALPVEWLRLACAARSSLSEALWHLTIADNAKLTDHIVSLVHRTARERVAYLLCDLLARLERLGLAGDHRFHMPLNQPDIGDLVGLSTVHVNRTLQTLRKEGLIRKTGRITAILKRDQLERIADFPQHPHETASEGEADGAGRARYANLLTELAPCT